jgi:UDP-N-acetylglucosamine 2-epimerase
LKILTIVGARPQFVKLAPVSRALRQRCKEVIVHTGQHYDDLMSAIFFRDLGIPTPDYNLEVGSGSHGEQTGKMLMHIEQVLLEEKPDQVLVYGDTNSTLAGALAAAKLYLPIAHVEAGLRDYRRDIPEEINRVLTDHLSTLLFCPTDSSAENLHREGIHQGVHMVGDVMLDALRQHMPVAERQSKILQSLDVRPQRYLLATVHRPINTDESAHLASILSAFGAAGETVVFPVHPRTRLALSLAGLGIPDNVRTIDPVSYLDMLVLEKNARMIVTDSGGIQKEAYILQVPCVTLLSQTAWIETVASGWNRPVGHDRDAILAAIRDFVPPAEWPALFGDGHASEKITEVMQS